jgi:hypothetical protein
MILPLPLQPYPCVAQELQSNTIIMITKRAAIKYLPVLGAGVMFI